MAKLFHSTPHRLHSFHRHTLHLISPPSLSPLLPPSSLSFLFPPPFSSPFLSPHSSSSFSLSISPSPNSLSFSLISRRNFSSHAFDSDNSNSTQLDTMQPNLEENELLLTKSKESEYPTGEFQFKEFGVWKKFVVKCRMFIAFPWERVKKGTVLTFKLRGQVSDQLKSRLSQGLSLPQLCENFIKAAYDPRISGVYLHIESLNCGWGKAEEIRRHILDFRKSGKFVVGYIPTCGEKEYYLACACEEVYAPPSAYFRLYGLTVQASFLGGIFEKVGIEPQVERIGKYKSAGDQLTRKSISQENRDMLTTLLDNIYGNWLDKISACFLALIK